MKTDTDNQKPYVFHPEYGLGDNYRLAVLMHSVAYGVRQAAKKHNVSQASVYTWRKKYSRAFATRNMKG
jgi:transposase